MPISKRNKQVELAKTKKRGLERKKALYEQIRSCVDTYTNVFVFSVTDMRNSKMKAVRNQWRHSRFFIGKNKVMTLALGRSAEEEYRPNLHKIALALKGSKCLLFSNQSTEEVMSWFRSYSESDYARSGNRATETVNLPEGPLPYFPHNLEPYLRQLGLPTTLVKGVVHLSKDHEVCKMGDILTPENAKILKLLGYEMAEFQIKIEAVWSRDETFIDFNSEMPCEDANKNAPNTSEVPKKKQKLETCKQIVDSLEEEMEVAETESGENEDSDFEVPINCLNPTAGIVNSVHGKTDRSEVTEQEASDKNHTQMISVVRLKNSLDIETTTDISAVFETPSKTPQKDDVSNLSDSTDNSKIKNSTDSKNEENMVVLNDTNQEKQLLENASDSFPERKKKTRSKIMKQNSADDNSKNQEKQLLENASDSFPERKKKKRSTIKKQNSADDNSKDQEKQLLENASDSFLQQKKKILSTIIKQNSADDNSSENKDDDLRQGRSIKRKANDKNVINKSPVVMNAADSSFESPIFRELRTRSVKVLKKKSKKVK